jgi:hypothetical protein
VQRAARERDRELRAQRRRDLALYSLKSAALAAAAFAAHYAIATLGFNLAGATLLAAALNVGFWGARGRMSPITIAASVLRLILRPFRRLPHALLWPLRMLGRASKMLNPAPISGRRRFLLQAGATAALIAAGGAYPFIEEELEERALEARLGPARERALRRLLALQYPDGGWGVGMVHHPGWDSTHMRVPITAIAVKALRGAGRGEAETARGERYVRDNMLLSQEELEARGETFSGNHDQPYTLAYALNLLLDRHEAAPAGTPAREAARRDVLQILDKIGPASWRYSNDGGMATFQLMLIGEALLRAKNAGFELPQRRAPAIDAPAPKPHPFEFFIRPIELPILPPLPPLPEIAPARPARATRPVGARPAAAAAPAPDVLSSVLDTLERSRQEDGTYPYHTHERTQGAEAMGRTVAVEYLLFKAGRSSPERLRKALDLFLANRREMERRILPSSEVTHDYSRHGWAKYYYLYAMTWAAQALAEPAMRGSWARRQARELSQALLNLQGEDGSVVDSREATGPAYGTASTLLIWDLLAKVRKPI